VLEGVLEFEVGGRRFTAVAGDVVQRHSHPQEQITVRLLSVTDLKIIG
jgi:quercetin dioxygenase-like cupin family protein